MNNYAKIIPSQWKLHYRTSIDKYVSSKGATLYFGILVMFISQNLRNEEMKEYVTFSEPTQKYFRN
jgi:hypothetical protein